MKQPSSELKKTDFKQKLCFYPNNNTKSLPRKPYILSKRRFVIYQSGIVVTWGENTIPKMVFLLSDDATSNLRFASLRISCTPWTSVTRTPPTPLPFIKSDSAKKIVQKSTCLPVAVDFHRGSKRVSIRCQLTSDDFVAKTAG